MPWVRVWIKAEAEAEQVGEKKLQEVRRHDCGTSDHRQKPFIPRRRNSTDLEESSQYSPPFSTECGRSLNELGPLVGLLQAVRAVGKSHYRLAYRCGYGP
ncbi:hypothetical protein E1B28_010863 [Marasmius oreades]|uniref:Uncharacterized protein n=1 Tax=Marasmius oreades TaxID=181124 RepID=A0A9P7RT34_9AGAR|nr:uncharacterized protein E1B28_010863 [Marasmius oreades]KAG7089157.1 hypothetical protein E1B28_010863 [Marasmius oreades]